MTATTEFGQYIRGIRENENLSREKFAELCGVSDKCIYNIENGFSEPKLTTALTICNICGIDTGKLGEIVNLINVTTGTDSIP